MLIWTDLNGWVFKNNCACRWLIERICRQMAGLNWSFICYSFFFFFEVETDPEDGHIIMWDVKSGGMDNSTPYIESINEIRNLLHKTWDGMDNSTPSK